MALRVGADDRDVLAAEMRGRPDRTELRVLEVGAAAGVRRGAGGVDQGRELALLGVDHRHLVAGVGRDHEIAAAAVEAAVVQEALGLDGAGVTLRLSRSV